MDVSGRVHGVITAGSGGLFSDLELARRAATLRSGMARLNVDCAVLHTADSVYYVTGIPILHASARPVIAVVPIDGIPTVIGSILEEEVMQSLAGRCEIVVFDDGREPTQVALELALAAARPSRRLGIELGFASFGFVRSIESVVGDDHITDISELLLEARLIKSDEELAFLRLAGQLAGIGAATAFELCVPGRSELDISSSAVAAMDRALADLEPTAGSSSTANVLVAERTLQPHSRSSGRRIEPGDVVCINVFPSVWGYTAELERTLLIAPKRGVDVEPLEAATDAYFAGRASLRAGQLMCDVDAAASSVLIERGLGATVRHGTGHALGIRVGTAGNESLGDLRPYNRRPLVAGMVSSVEPGVYVAGQAGYRHSDTLLVTNAEPAAMTEFPLRLGD